MSSKEILKQALKLKPDERFMVVEGLIKSLDEPTCLLAAHKQEGRVCEFKSSQGESCEAKFSMEQA